FGGIGGFILCWMTPLPLFIVGLRLGQGPVWAAGLTGALALTAIAFGLERLFALSMAVPVALLVGLALRRPYEKVAGRLVLALTTLGIAAFALAYGLAWGEMDGLRGASIATVRDAVKQMQDLVAQTATGIELPEMSEAAIERAGEELP